MKRTALFLLLFLAPLRPAPAQYSLTDAVRMAVESNAGLRASQSTLRAREAGARSAWGRLLPEIDVQGMYTVMDKDLILDLDPIRAAMISLQTGNQVGMANLESLVRNGRALTAQEQATIAGQARTKLEGALPHFQETVKEKAFPQAVVSLRQPLFAGGRILAGIRAADAQTDLARYTRDARQGEVMRDVVTRYLGVLLADQNLAVRERALAGIRDHSRQAQRLEEQGLIARHDRLRADVALAEAERALFDAREKRDLAVIALAESMGTGELPIPTDSLRYRPVVGGVEDFLSPTTESNPSLLALKSAGRALHEKASVTRGAWYPTVFGFGMVNLFDHYMVPNLEPKWAVGVGASIQIFDGLRRSNDCQSADAEADAMEYTVRDAERSLRLLVRNEYLKLRSAEERWNRLLASETQAEENLRLNRKRYDTGLGTSLEVIDAELSLQAILLQRSQALVDYHSSLFALCQTMGDPSAYLRFWSGLPLHP